MNQWTFLAIGALALALLVRLLPYEDEEKKDD